jgi:hypothetical protein
MQATMQFTMQATKQFTMQFTMQATMHFYNAVYNAVYNANTPSANHADKCALPSHFRVPTSDMQSTMELCAKEVTRCSCAMLVHMQVALPHHFRVPSPDQTCNLLRVYFQGSDKVQP